MSTNRAKMSVDESVHIIMVTWNALAYTKIALESLFKYTDVPYCLTIVDNGSKDETLDYLDRLSTPDFCLKFSLIANHKNLGYGNAIVQGDERVKSQYVCVVNNDVMFSPKWLQGLLRAIGEDPLIGILGPLRPAPWCKHPYSDESTDGVLEKLNDDLPPLQELSAYCLGKDYDTFVKDVRKINDFGLKYFSGPPIHIVTCCALLRREIVDKVGGLADLDYKTFGAEDTDLSWRISAHGYKLVVTSGVYVHHFKHKSSDENNLNRKKFCRVNNEVFYQKWKSVIKSFLNKEIQNGIDVKKLMSDEAYYEYWFLRRLKENIGNKRFWEGVSLTD